MIFSYPKGDGEALPLTVRVIAAEEQLHHREEALRARASQLSNGFRDRLVSPSSLLLAAGAGYLMAEFTERRRASAPAVPQPPHAEKRAGRGVLGSLYRAGLMLYDFARPMLSTYVEEKLRQHVHLGAAQHPAEEPPDIRLSS
jgi:hypothetical protein